jgi:hypothetical protein
MSFLSEMSVDPITSIPANFTRPSYTLMPWDPTLPATMPLDLYKDPGAILTYTNVAEAIRERGGYLIQPYVEIIPTSTVDGFQTDGFCFRFVLRSTLGGPTENFHAPSAYGIPSDLAWEYVACDYLRHLHIGTDALPAYMLSKDQYDAFKAANTRQWELHTLFFGFLVK